MAGTSAFTATFTPIAKGKSMVMTGKIIRGDAQRLVDAYNASCAQRNRCPDRIFLTPMAARYL